MEGTRRNQAAAHRVDLVNPHAQEGHIAPSITDPLHTFREPCRTTAADVRAHADDQRTGAQKTDIAHSEFSTD